MNEKITKSGSKKVEAKKEVTKAEGAEVVKAPAADKISVKPSAQPKVPTTQIEIPKPKVLNLSIVQKEIEALKQVVQEHSEMMAELQEALARKRKPTANGRIEIKDKQTGKVYPSKNNCYQSLLKSGDLKDLVSKGIFGAEPEKNNFGWFALVRAWPDRFEEVKAEQTEKKA